MDKNNTQTAVEWLVEQICTSDMANLIFQQEIKKAKQMEKEQIVGAYLEGDRNGFTRYKSVNVEQRTSEQYYNETYGKGIL